MVKPNLSQPNVILHVMDDSLSSNIKELDHIPPAVASDLIEVGFLRPAGGRRAHDRDQSVLTMSSGFQVWSKYVSSGP